MIETAGAIASFPPALPATGVAGAIPGPVAAWGQNEQETGIQGEAAPKGPACARREGIR